ncbi:hypothetical protein [Mesorhizobium loti]|nr:hypothetical protein [Mesorhizobium loti]
MRRDEICSVSQAAYIAKRTEKTIRGWVKRYGIGRQATKGAPIEISRVALLMVLQGELETLEILRNGYRSHPDVLRFIREVGVPE